MERGESKRVVGWRRCIVVGYGVTGSVMMMVVVVSLG